MWPLRGWVCKIMAVKVEYSVNMQRKSFHVFLGLAIGKYEAPMELFLKKIKK
jgi:hypothetical protein